MLPRLHKIVESLLYASSEPLTEEQVRKCIGENVSLKEIIERLNEYYLEIDSPLWVQEISNGYRLMTRSEYEVWISRLNRSRQRVRLTNSALETLAIVVYNQPVTKSEIDSIRGVSSEGPIRTLLSRRLIEIKGRKAPPGRSLLYGTTPFFLEYFGLKSIDDLPSIKEIEEIYGEEGK